MSLSSTSPILSPHHLGESLVERLLAQADLAALPAHDPARPSAELTVAGVLSLSARPTAIVGNAPLESQPGAPRFDGMHDVDCAVLFADEAIAIELKLGVTALAPATFASRFVAKAPRLTHGGSAIAGSMVALLDANGRDPGAGPAISLRTCGLPVRRQWLLMLREGTWTTWARDESLQRTLGTSQLAGVLTLEDLVRHVGGERAREVARQIARESIDSWFSETIGSSVERST